MSDTIQERIDRCIALKNGDKQIAIFYFPDGTWRVLMGNRSQHVWLGEQEGEFDADGNTLAQALDTLEAMLTPAK